MIVSKKPLFFNESGRAAIVDSAPGCVRKSTLFVNEIPPLAAILRVTEY